MNNNFMEKFKKLKCKIFLFCKSKEIELFKYIHIPKNDSDLLGKCDLFDYDFYSKVSNQVNHDKKDLVRHFLDEGWLLGFSPQPLFDMQFYNDKYSDVKNSGMNPFIHYLRFGFHEGRDTHELFSVGKYSKTINWKPFKHGNPLLHYIYNNDLKHVLSVLDFDRGQYFCNFPFLSNSKKHPIYHYLSDGFKSVDLPTNMSLDSNTKGKLREGNFKEANNSFFFNFNPFFLNRKITLIRSGKIQSIDDLKESSVLIKINTTEISVDAPLLMNNVNIKFQSFKRNSIEKSIKLFKNIGNIGGSRLLIDHNFNFYHDEISRNLDECFDSKMPFFVKRDGDNFTFQFENSGHCRIKEGIITFCEHNNNYFHWLVEVLPKILLIEQANIDPNVPILVECNMHPNLISALHIVMNIKRPLLYVHRANFYRIEELYYVSDLSVMLDRYAGKLDIRDVLIDDYFLPLMIRRIKEKVVKLPSKKVKRKVYIKRGAAKMRMLLNEEEIVTYLQSLGFEILDINGFSFQEQVTLFSEIDYMITPSGAACTNMMFMPEKSRVVILCFEHDNANLYFFNQLSERSKVDLNFIVGKPNYDLVGKYSVHDNYIIPLELFRKYIN